MDNNDLTPISETTLIDKELNPQKYLNTDDLLLGDEELAPFLIEWLKNGFNAGKAYKKLHPEVSDASARVLASRKLTKVNKSAILAAFGIDISSFFTQLQEGLKAEKWNEFTGEKIPDHRVRLEYLKIVGKLLDLPI